MQPLSHAINSLLQKNQAFALYYPPGGNEPELVMGKTEHGLHLPEGIMSSEHFVFAPYKATNDTPIYLIQKETYAKGEYAIGEAIEKTPTKEEIAPIQTPSTHLDQEAYKAIVEQGVNEIKANSDLEKIVLARSFELKQTLDLGALLPQLKATLPNAFCYLVHIPQQGTWLGATPEKLLIIQDGQAHTNALAGTLPADSTEAWTEKEIDEQQIVTDYIASNLEAIGINNYKTEGPTTHQSGSVKHLRTNFDFAVNPMQTKQLIEALHPTPAVCGLPKEKADALITTLEPNSRAYYAGYLGPLNINNESHIFVNLRCMKANEDTATLYVGAGITAGSIPAKEWQETEVKALTLLNVIRN